MTLLHAFMLLEHSLLGQLVAIPLAAISTGYAVALYHHRHPKGETR